jgi:hypothetical protein
VPPSDPGCRHYKSGTTLATPEAGANCTDGRTAKQ